MKIQPSKPFIAFLKGFALIVAMTMLYGFLDNISAHCALLYWWFLATTITPIAFWWTGRMKIPLIVACLSGILVTLSPIDLLFMSSPRGTHIMPTSSGNATREGTFGYGCLARYPPPKILIVSL